MLFQYRRSFLSALLIMVCLTLPGDAFGFQKLKIGNGALLRKMFGGRDDEATPKKAEKPPAKATDKKGESKLPFGSSMSRSAFEETRRKLEEDARRMQEDLRNRFKSPFSTNRETSPQPPSPTSSQSMRSVLSAQPTNRNVPQPLVRSGITPRDAGPENQPRVTAESRRPRTPSTPSQLPVPPLTTAQQAPRGLPAGPGFGVIGISATGGGIQVRQIKPGSAAESIGIQPGDILENVAGLDLSAVEEIDAITNVMQEGDQFEVAFRRNGKPQSRTLSGAAVAQLPAPPRDRQNWPQHRSSDSLPLQPASSRNTTGRLTPPSSQFDPLIQRMQPGTGSRPTPTTVSPQVLKMQEQLQQQQRTIQQLQQQLKRQQSIQPQAPQRPIPQPEVKSVEEDDNLGLELNLEPPR